MSFILRSDRIIAKNASYWKKITLYDPLTRVTKQSSFGFDIRLNAFEKDPISLFLGSNWAWISFS